MLEVTWGFQCYQWAFTRTQIYLKSRETKIRRLELNSDPPPLPCMNLGTL